MQNTISLFPHCFDINIKCIANERTNQPANQPTNERTAKTDDWNEPHAHTTVYFVMVHADIHSLSAAHFRKCRYEQMWCASERASEWVCAKRGGRLCTHNFHPEKQSILQSKQVLRVLWKIFYNVYYVCQGCACWYSIELEFNRNFKMRKVSQRLHFIGNFLSLCVLVPIEWIDSSKRTNET